MPRIRSLRFRIALSYIVGAVLVSGLVALGTYVITARVLTSQAIDNAKAQTFDEVTFLRDQIRDEGSRDLRIYLQTLQQRGSDVVATVPNSQADSTSVGLSLRTIPQGLQDAVERGRVGYAIYDGPGHRQLAFGSPVPGGTTTPIHVYFNYSLRGVDDTLQLLWQVLVGVVAAAAIIAGGVGLRLADRTIRPLRAAADAARRVAEGGLETRLSEEGADELARLAADFNRMTRALEQRMARERQFVSDVSHELRTPLTTLKTSIEYIADRVAGQARLASAVGLAADEMRSLARLVDDLLELTRAEAGGAQVSSDEVDLRDFAAEIVRRRAPETVVEIEGPEHLRVRTDKSRLERVVGNLVENAVVHGGGDNVRITLDQSNGFATITVADDGPGISEDELPHVFDRFWRGDRARQRGGKVGAGLGMSIARENARLIGADLRVDSVPGQGARFHVLLKESSDP